MCEALQDLPPLCRNASLHHSPFTDEAGVQCSASSSHSALCENVKSDADFWILAFYVNLLAITMEKRKLKWLLNTVEDILK